MTAAAPQKIRILTVDDHPMVRDGLRSMLLTADDLEVVGEASTAGEAVTQAEALQPDVVLLDVQLPDEDGLTALRRIKAVVPTTNVLMVTMHENAAYVTQAITWGAAGYVLKGVRRLDLIEAVRAVVTGVTVSTPVLLGRAQRQSAKTVAQAMPQMPCPAEPLSPVEHELLRLLAEGLSNKQIGLRMNWSLGTVKKYVQRLFDKLQVTDRTQAVVEAIRRGVIAY
jgi:DNA-binding NarL/FixJ family response regulator